MKEIPAQSAGGGAHVSGRRDNAVPWSTLALVQDNPAHPHMRRARGGHAEDERPSGEGAGTRRCRVFTGQGRLGWPEATLRCDYYARTQRGELVRAQLEERCNLKRPSHSGRRERAPTKNQNT